MKLIHGSKRISRIIVDKLFGTISGKKLTILGFALNQILTILESHLQ